MNKYNPIKMTPFKWFILENFPFIEEDFDSLTSYGLWCKLKEYFDKVATKTNETGTKIEELTNAFLQLKEYIDNYFNNLDVQEEINTKLDEMAESGDLAEIIAQYLESQAIIGFNTVSSLANAENLANGSFARTLGKQTYNDGKGAFYKIRTRTNADTPDGDNLVVLVNTENLVAEKMTDFEINSLKTRVTNIENRNNLIDNRKFLIVGDSYAEGYTPDGNVTSWASFLKNLLGLSNDNCIIAYQGGSGLVANGTNTFYNIINNLQSDNNITDIIIAGGYNDTGATLENTTEALSQLNTLINNKFPNIKNKYLGFIAGSSTPSKKYNLYKCCERYIHSANENKFKYLNNVEYSLKNYFECFSSDGFHPHSTGQYQIALNIYNAIKNGSADVKYGYKNIYFDKNDIFTGQGGSYTFGATIENGTTFVNLQGMFNLFSSGFSYKANGTNLIEIGDITDGFITGSGYYLCSIPVSVVIQDDNKYYATNGFLIIENNKLYLRILQTNETNNDYKTYNSIRQIQIAPFSACFDTLFC